MTSRAARRSAIASREKPSVKPKRSYTLLVWLGSSVVVTLIALIVLKLADVRLGQGYFAIRYSPFSSERLERTLPLIVVAMLACGGIWAIAKRDQLHRRIGHALLLAASLGAGCWAWWAPPEPMAQQAFNMRSFSTDGAFLFEASKFKSLPQYLQNFPNVLQQSPRVMGGTRVLSNPPLVTILSYATCYAWRSNPTTLDRFEQMLLEDYEVEPRDVKDLADALRVGMLLCALWVLSAWAAYLLGRRFLSPAGAATFALIVTFNPCTVHYAPGKDAAQLLTINLMLWAWFRAWQQRSFIMAALGGAILTIGSTAGLVHIWIALIAVTATLWQAMADRSGLRTIVFNSTAAAVGGITTCLAAYLTWGWNIPGTLLAVSSRWSELQNTFDINRPIWFAIGLPIFVLFLSPGFWALLGLTIRRRRLGFGARIALCTAAIMLLTYGPFGMTYELPRLWIAFLPPLVLGLAIDHPMLCGRFLPLRAVQALVLIAAVQIGFTALHWTIFDAREVEYRLSTERLFN
jgi:hypothetical protein